MNSELEKESRDEGVDLYIQRQPAVMFIAPEQYRVTH